MKSNRHSCKDKLHINIYLHINIHRAVGEIAKALLNASRFVLLSNLPIADQREYRPPTQSQNPNMLFSASIPKSATFGLFVDRAIKCLATALSYAQEKYDIN